MLPGARPTWRCNVVVLALACLGNATVLFVVDEPGPLTKASSMLSSAAATALIMSLMFEIKMFTLAVAALAMWMQSIEVISSGVAGWSKVRLGLVFLSLGCLAFGAWVQAMSGRWPKMRRLWCIPLI